MSKQRINVGTGINTGTGDTLRSAMEKCNNNFDELYDLMGQDSTGKSIDISGNTISSTFTNTDINISPNGSGDTVISSDLVVNKIKSDDSAQVTVEDGLTVTGAVVMLSNLPTSDPSNAGQLWNDSGTLKVSAG
jgi:energy-converting hydrogenase Eha subunit B